MLKVHAVDAGDCGRHGENGSPRGQPPRNGSLLRLPNHQAGFKSERQHLAYRVDLFP